MGAMVSGEHKHSKASGWKNEEEKQGRFYVSSATRAVRLPEYKGQIPVE